MIIPWQRLSEEALNNVLESFVLREGTDYGEIEKTLDEKVDDLKRQLVNNEIAIFWSELYNSLDLRRL